MAYDFPNAPANGDIIQTAGQRFEYVSSYPRWEYRGAAQLNAGAGITVPGTNTWGDTATSLTATGCVQLSADNVTFGATLSVANGATFYTRWDPGATCEGAAHGTTITGTITDDTTGASQSYTKTIDKVPDAFTLSNATQNVPSSTATTASCFVVSGTTADPYIWGTVTGGTNAQYNVNGGAYATLPTAPGTATVSEGDTVCVLFTTSAATSGTETLQVCLGESVASSTCGTQTVSVGKTAFTGTVQTPTSSFATTQCFTWDSGADTIYSTGCLEFNVNGGAYGQANQAVVNGDTVCSRWKDGTGPGTTCSDAVHGTVIGGTIESATRSYSASLTIDKAPAAFDFTAQTGIGLSTTVTSNTVTISGTNSVSYLQWTPDATNPLTSVQASINGGAFTAVPAVGTYTLEVPVGATIQVQGTTGATISTAYTGTFTIGDAIESTTDTWTVTTAAGTPSIQTPSITTPASGSTSVGSASGITLTGSTYTPLNGAGATQTSSTWEVYKNSYPLTSTNSITAVAQNAASWTNRGSGQANGISQMGYDGTSKWLTVASSATAIYSTDNWSNRSTVSTGGAANLKGVDYGNGSWILCGDSGVIRYSTNGGTTWTSTTNGTKNLWSVNFDGSTKFLITGATGAVLYGSDGSWSNNNFGTNDLWSAAYGSGTWVIVGNAGTIYTSTNGTSGTSRTSGTTQPLYGVAYGQGKWCAVGATGTVLTSPDGVTWTSRSFGTGIDIISVKYSNGLWVAAGNSGAIRYSEDAITWTASFSTGNGLDAVQYGGGVWTVAGDSGQIYTSTAPAGSTTLTIAGAQTDGFLVGDSITDGGAAAGTITAVSDTSVTVSPQDTDWGAGDFLTRGTSMYTAVTGSPFTVSSAPFTSLSIAKPPLEANTTYWARVQYATTNAAAATSSYSAWSSFTTGTLTPAIGEAYGGGYFGGQINAGGTIYNLIVAPVTSGALQGQFGGATATTVIYKNASTADAPAATVQNEAYGGTTSDLFDTDGGVHPLFNWLSSATGPNGGTMNLATGGAGGGAGIGGYTDWYIPAKNELEILYRNLKPDTSANNTASGANANAVPTATGNYTASDPAQTANTLFQTGGAQAFSTADRYWSSTEVSSNTTEVWRQNFPGGSQSGNLKSNGSYARAIRRVAA